MPVAVYLGCSENVLARQYLLSGATDDSYAYIETGAKNQSLRGQRTGLRQL